VAKSKGRILVFNLYRQLIQQHVAYLIKALELDIFKGYFIWKRVSRKKSTHIIKVKKEKYDFIMYFINIGQIFYFLFFILDKLFFFENL